MRPHLQHILAIALASSAVAACAGADRRSVSIAVTASRDTIQQLDTVTFTAHVSAPASAARLGWSWAEQPGLPDPWTHPCASIDTVCRIQVHGTGSMYYRVRRATGPIDSARAFVVATIPPDVALGDEPGDADPPPRPAWVGCYRFSHQPFVGNLMGVRIDTVVVRLTNDVFFWEGPHVPQYHLEPAPAAVGINATRTERDPFTSKWHPLTGDSIRLEWGLRPPMLRADVVPANDSLHGVIYVVELGNSPSQRLAIEGKRLTCPASLP